MHQNVSLGPNGVNRVRSLQKIPTQLHSTDFCTSSARFAPSFVRQPSSPECTKTWVYGPIGWIRSVHCEKFLCYFMARTCALIAPVQPVLHRVSCSNEILPNTPKHYEEHTNMSLGSNGGGLGAFIAKNSKTTSWHKHCQMHPITTRRTKTWV